MKPQEEDPRDDLSQRDTRPVVLLPQAGLSGVGIAIICAIFGIGLFFILDANRRRIAEGDGSKAPAQAVIASPAPLAVPPPPFEPAQQPPTLAVEEQESVRPAMERTPPLPSAPAYAPPVALSEAGSMPAAPARTAGEGADSPLIIDLASADGLGNASAAAGAAGDDQAVRASVIRNRSSLVPQGSMISAVLETPIDSRRPGLVRAVVSRDARGFDGTRVLIPRGSRLIGEASGDAKPGQKRVLVTWTRLIRPDGVAIRIGSPAADVLGGAGVRGKINTHFFERFGNAVLQSALTIGVNVASRPRNNAVIVGLPGQIDAAGQDILANVDQGPTIKVPSGAEISVFVARDLDFSGTGLRR